MLGRSGKPRQLAETLASIPVRDRLVVALLPVSAGAAVVVTVLLAPDSLLAPLVVLMAGTGMAAVVVMRRLPADMRRVLIRRTRIGLVAGIAALVAYDGVRWALVTLAGWSADPFGAFPLFGELLIGIAEPVMAVWVAGSAFHLLTGLGFAVAYVLVFSRPGLVTAVMWALVLEGFTLMLYPSWLAVGASAEFVTMSLSGHVAFGLALGAVAIRLTRGAAVLAGRGRPGE